jgi:hypothetical protein
MKAQLKVTEVTDHAGGKQIIKCVQVHDPSIPEDQRFQKGSAWGEVMLQVDKSAADQLKLGSLFYADFTAAPT